MTSQHFLGLDLAWRSSGNTSALAVLAGDQEQVELTALLPTLLADADILTAIEEQSTADSVLAVDAPLVIGNISGQRSCERLIGQRYGHADASAHTSNLNYSHHREASGWRPNLLPAAGTTTSRPQLTAEGVAAAIRSVSASRSRSSI